MLERKLTKEEVLEKHAAMWNEMADHLEQGQGYTKHDYIREHDPELWYMTGYCYLCEYAVQQMKKRKGIPLDRDCSADLPERCPHCPLDWPGECCVDDDDGLFIRYRNAMDYLDFKEAASAAREIANLPAKE